jgi:hypothetical protein
MAANLGGCWTTSRCFGGAANKKPPALAIVFWPAQAQLCLVFTLQRARKYLVTERKILLFVALENWSETSRHILTLGGMHHERFSMSFIRKPETAELDKPAEAEIEANIRDLVTDLRQVGRDEVSANELSSLFHRDLANSTREIDDLIGELQTLRKGLPETSSRIDREIVEYVAVSQSVRQLVKVFTESVTRMKQ